MRLRIKSNTNMYHVMAKGINKENIFNQDCEKIYLKKIIRQFLEEYEIEIYAYCIMSTHLHLILRAEISDLSSFMAKILAKYAEYYNYKHGRNGHVFQNRFKSECIESEQYYWNCLRYIHLNPVKANQAKDTQEYKYSSMNEYLLREIKLINEKAIKIFDIKFKDKKSFLTFHKEPVKEIFIDTPTDLYIHQKNIALLLLEDIKEKYKLKELRSVIEDCEMRKIYKKELRVLLQTSVRKAEKLFLEIKEQFF